ncbi:MAG: CBS domain-containing protein [Candidatus Omnitrophota bacterium]
MTKKRSPKVKVNFQKILAQDLMSEVVVNVTQDTLVKEVAHLMLRDRISGLPVVDRKKNIVGMLTISDLLRVIDESSKKEETDFYEQVFQFRERKVKEIMSTKVITVSPHTTLDVILHIMLKKKIHGFPVVKSGKLIGIIGRHDILNAVFTFY